MTRIKTLVILLLPVLLLTGCGDKSYIKIKGDTMVTHTYGVEYKDEGYEVNDKKVIVTVDNDVDVNKLGEYQVTYIALKQNKEVERSVRVVKVVDNKAPEIETLDEIEVFLNDKINDDVLKKAMSLNIKDNYDKTEDIKVELFYEIDVTKEGQSKLNITATDTNNNKSTKEVNVKVTKVNINKISLNKSSLSLNEGGSSMLSVTYSPSNAVDDKTVTWSSSNESVAKVSNGKVSAVGVGSAKVCATLKSNSKIQSCVDVKVSESQVAKFQKFLVSIGYVKKSSTLYQKYDDGYTYKVNFANKTFLADDGEGPLTYYYKSGKGTYVFYYSNGAVKTINYTYSSNKYSCSVNPSYMSQLCNNVDNGIEVLKSLEYLFDTMITAADVKVSGL